MNIEKVGSAPSFGSLNIKKVASTHQHFINENASELMKLGEKYDIVMKSSIGSDLRCDGIDIVVKDLRKNLSFFQKLNRPKGQSYFLTERHYDTSAEPPTFMEQIKNAIENLRKNSL